MLLAQQFSAHYYENHEINFQQNLKLRVKSKISYRKSGNKEPAKNHKNIRLFYIVLPTMAPLFVSLVRFNGI